MKKVYLHGGLSDGIRSEWELNVKTPAEAIRAINVNCLGALLENIYKLADEGSCIGFACLSSEESKTAEKINSEEDVSEQVMVEFLQSPERLDMEGDFDEIHIMPAVDGNFVVTPTLTAAFIAKTVFMMVVGMLIAGIAAAMFPPVKVTNNTRTTKSYSFGDRPNIRRQGGPIPVGYGMLRLGSITSSFSRRNKFLPGGINNGMIESYTSFVTHDLISEGPIEGFCDSNGISVAPYSEGQYKRFDKNPVLKSIFINDVKLMNDQGQLNIIPNEDAGAGETQPIFSLGYNSDSRTHKNPSYGIDYEKKGQSPLIGPDKKISGFASNVKKSGASAFTYAVSDRNVGILTLNISSERMFNNWTDKRVRRRLFGTRVSVTQGTDPVAVQLAIRIFDGKKYVSPIDVRGGDSSYSQLEDVDKSKQNYTSNYTMSKYLGEGNHKPRITVSDSLLVKYFTWTLFESLSTNQYHFSGPAHPEGWESTFVSVSDYNSLPDSQPSSSTTPWKGWYLSEPYSKPLKSKLFHVVRSAEDFVQKFQSAYLSSATFDFMGQGEKTLKEIFSMYFDDNKRIEEGVLKDKSKSKISTAAEVLGVLSAQTRSGVRASDIFLNNFHLCMSLIKSHLDEDQTLGNDGNIYVTRSKMYYRHIGKTYAKNMWEVLALAKKGSNWSFDKKKQKWFKYKSKQYISSLQYSTRNLKFRNQNGDLVSSPFKDQSDNPWVSAGNWNFNQSIITIRGISTAPASIDFNIQLPYIGQGESLTVQLVRITPEITGVQAQAETQKRLSLKGIRQHKTIAGKRMSFSSPCTAWIATEFDSVNFQQIPDRNYLVKLKKVAVPSNYNVYSRSCLGAWNGLFRGQLDGDRFSDISESDLVWTENPAWILLDILTNTRFGIGKSGLSAEDIDIWNLYNVSKFCDELVETGFPNERPYRAFVTDNRSPDDVSEGVPAKNYLIGSGAQDAEYWDQFSKAKTFEVLVVDENGELVTEEEFSREFNQGFADVGNTAASGNNGKTVAFFMEDGSVDRKIISSIDVSRRALILYGPSFILHPTTKNVTSHSLVGEGLASGQEFQITEGKCVAEVSYPLVEPRFSINTIYTEQENALDVVRELTSSFRTVLNYINGQISFSPENYQEPVMLFTDANVDKSGFAYAGASKASRVTVAKVTYTDRFDEFKSKVEYFEDPSGIEKFGYIEQDIIGLGCTSRGQAQRLARFTVVAPLLEGEIVSFKCGLEGSMLYPGAIIEISDSRRFGQNVNGRIKKIEKDSRSISIDKIISNVKFYDPVTDKDNDRVELCIASPQGFEEVGVRESSDGEPTGLYKKMKILSAASSEFDVEDQESLIAGSKRSQIIYFDGFLSSNKRKIVELRRKYKFTVKPLSKNIKSPYHGLGSGDIIQFISFGVLPQISYMVGSEETVRKVESFDYFRVNADYISNHNFKIEYISNYGGSNESFHEVTFEDSGFVTRDEDISGGEHFYYIEKSVKNVIDDTVSSLEQVSVGSAWAIRGYRREFFGELERQAQNLQSALATIGSESINDSNKYWSDLFGAFTVTRYDSVHRNFLQIDQSSNSGSGLGGFSISIDPAGDFLRQENSLPYRAVDHFLFGKMRFLSSISILVESESPTGEIELFHFYRPSLEYGILRCESSALASSGSKVDFKDVARDHIQINSNRWKVFNRQETFTTKSGETVTRQCNYIKVDDKVNGPTLAEIELALSGGIDDVSDVSDINIEIQVPINYDINDYKNVGRRQYRINSISEENGSYDIKASEYNREKFGIIEKSLSLNRPSLPIPPQVNMSIPKAPSDITIKDLTFRNE